MKKTSKKKVVKAWAIIRNLNDEICSEQSRDYTNLAIFATEEYAVEACNGIGIRIIPVTITYEI